MYQGLKKTIGVTATLFTMLLIGCATAPVDLEANGTVRVAVENSENTDISEITVRQYSGELLIHADVRPSKPERFFYPGHLRFVMADANGDTVWDLIVTRYTNEDLVRGVSKMKHASFWVRMPVAPLTGAVLTVMHHEGPANDDEKKAP